MYRGVLVRRCVNIRNTAWPHADYGDPTCPGLLFPVIHGDVATIECNDCDFVLKAVPANQADEAMVELTSNEICSATCPHCGELNIIQGFSSVSAFICRHC